MRFREYLRKHLDGQVPNNVILPSGFHLVGHVALVELDPAVGHITELIGNLILRFDQRVQSVTVKSGPTKGVFRKPEYRLVAGRSDTTTIHVENGVKFRLDPLCITFSGGNKAERIRMVSIVNATETVVDMFACVGQFALPIAFHSNAKVIAIELNHKAYTYLLENIHLNRLNCTVSAIHGDCRIERPSKFANRVIMGYLHDTIEYLPQALETLSSDGGVIHMHVALSRRGLDDYRNTINTLCLDYGYVERTTVRIVKTYSPGVEHFVFDIMLDGQ